ncbi:gpi-anchored wall transfer protein [Stemphylium lycopersici]|nr:gpi-anchored wall transfer protein [Stemphylium lycopersici]
MPVPYTNPLFEECAVTDHSRMRLFTPNTPPALFLDFLLNCGVTLFATTIYSSTPWILNLLLLLPAVALYVLEKPAPTKDASRPLKIEKSKKDVKPDALPVKPFITNYRGAMMIITCVAILAVDFRVFPRRFAKVENWGTSLMDMGVGSFVFTAGVVSVRASLKEGGGRQPLTKRLAASLRHAVPLLVLGTIRLISVKGLDYAEHVTEYGVHWNFFFTLGFLPPFAALFQTAFDLVPSYAVLSFVLAAAYEMALDWTSLGSYILVAARTDLLSKNREGVFSFFGYLAIFLAGQSLGASALPRQQPVAKDASLSVKLRQTTLGKLATTSVIWTALFFFCTGYYGLRLPVSRRLANLPYFLWVSSFNSYQITICCAIETFLFPNLYKATSKEEELVLCGRAHPVLKMSTPQAKRRRLNEATKTLQKPFKSPFRTPLKPSIGDDPPSSDPPELNTPTATASAEGSAPIRPTIPTSNGGQQASTTTRSGLQSTARPPALRPSKPLLPHLTSSKPSRVATKKTPSKPSLAREIMQLRNEIQMLTQAQTLATSTKDDDLVVLVDKWRTASRAAAEELFGCTRDRVNRMGGVGAWKEREKESKQRQMQWDQEEMQAERERMEEAKENGEVSEEAYDRYAEMEGEREKIEEEKETFKGADDDSFTMDMMLKTLNIDLRLIGYNEEAQRWEG